jgi:hypothetical protein
MINLCENDKNQESTKVLKAKGCLVFETASVLSNK